MGDRLYGNTTQLKGTQESLKLTPIYVSVICLIH